MADATEDSLAPMLRKQLRPDDLILVPVNVEAAVEARRPALCVDSGKNTEPFTSDGRPLFKKWDTYFLRDDVWAEAGMDLEWGTGAYLCSACLPKRLGRDPVGEDFVGMVADATATRLDFVLEAGLAASIWNAVSKTHDET